MAAPTSATSADRSRCRRYGIAFFSVCVLKNEMKSNWCVGNICRYPIVWVRRADAQLALHHRRHHRGVSGCVFSCAPDADDSFDFLFFHLFLLIIQLNIRAALLPGPSRLFIPLFTVETTKKKKINENK